MERDRLFLLQASFEDPAYPGSRFYCWHCALMEGLLAIFPEHLRLLEVERIPWPRPRQRVVSLLGEENQSLPLLLLAATAPKGLETGRFGDHRFVTGKDEILYALSVRYGLPKSHP